MIADRHQTLAEALHIPWRSVDAPPPPQDLPCPTAISEGPFLINFTSGTTSAPKAFSRSRASWRASFAVGDKLFGLDDRPRTLSPGALCHGLALYAMMETLEAGGTFYSVERWNRDAVADTLIDQSIERLVLVPTMLAALCEVGRYFGSVRSIVTAGAKLSRAPILATGQAFPNAGLSEYYGASELSFISYSPRADEGHVGTAFPGVSLVIRDAAFAPVPPGQAGMIWVKSLLLCDGYLWGEDEHGFRINGDEATVGDQGILNPDGTLTVLGRSGGMVITGGFNVYTQEVEEVVRAAPRVKEAVVLGLHDAYRGTRLVAVVSGTPLLEAVLAHCAEHLPRYKIPREVYHIADWPMTSSGKIARGRVEQAVLAGDDPSVRPLV